MQEEVSDMALKQHVSLELRHFHVQIFTPPKQDKTNLKLAPKEQKKLIYLVKSMPRNVLACCLTKLNEH